MDEPNLDCLVIGAGPAGLTAAIYLARFHLSLRVVDEGRSRASWIACTRNVPGFHDGIAGNDLLDRMRRQAGRYGAVLVQGRVTRLEVVGGGFQAEWGEGTATARTVLLATGVKNRRLDMDEELHDAAMARGLIRYCPICDGYEATDRKIGVIGSGSHGVEEAVFLRSFSADVTLIAPDKTHHLRPEDQELLQQSGVTAVDGPSRGVAVQEDCVVVETASGHLAFDCLYPALGTDTHIELAQQAGAQVSEETGCIIVDSHQRTSVPGLYAAGDVVLGLDQISHAMGDGGVAATAIRNALAKERPLLR